MRRSPTSAAPRTARRPSRVRRAGNAAILSAPTIGRRAAPRTESAAVGDGDHVGREHVHQPLQVARVERREEPLDDLLAARRGRPCTRGRRAATCSFARWAICRTAAGDLSTASAISSYGTSNTSRSTNTARSVGAERLEHGQHRDRDALGELDVVGDIRTREQRLGQPLAHVVLAPPRHRAQLVERLPGHDPHEVRARIAHLARGRRRPTAARTPAARPRRRPRSRASRTRP